MVEAILENAQRSIFVLNEPPAKEIIKSIPKNSLLKQLQKTTNIDNNHSRGCSTEMIRASGYYENDYKALAPDFLKAVELGASLESVEDAGNAIGDKGRKNSRTTAKALEILRSLDIKLEDHGLDRKTTPSRRQTFRNKVNKRISAFNPFHIKNSAKAGTNFSKFMHLPVTETALKHKIDITVNQATSPTAIDVGLTSGSLIEYISGMAVAIINLKNLLQGVSTENSTRKKLEQYLCKLEPLLDKKAKLLSLLTSDSDEYLRKSLTVEISAIDTTLKEATINIIAIAQQIEHALKTNQFKDTCVSSLSILRYVASTTANGLTLAAKLSPEASTSIFLLHSAFATATGAGGLAAILNSDSLISSIKKYSHNESFKSSLQSSITVIDKKIRTSESQICQLNKELALAMSKCQDKEVADMFEDFTIAQKPIKQIISCLGKAMQGNSRLQKDRDLAVMILAKQPRKLTNASKIGLNIFTTGGYVAGTVSAGAGIAILTGLGGATGVFLVATPAGWALGGSGAAMALGLSIHKAGLHYLHHKDLSKTIKASLGENKNIRTAVSIAKKENRTLGPAHEILLKHLESSSNLPAKSSRAGVEVILNRLLDEMGNVLETDAFLPDISIIEHKGKTDFILNNPVKETLEYQEVKTNSDTFQFIKSLFSKSKQAAVDSIFDKMIEAARLGQTNMVREIIAALLNIEWSATKHQTHKPTRSDKLSTKGDFVIEPKVENSNSISTGDIQPLENLNPTTADLADVNDKAASKDPLNELNLVSDINLLESNFKNTKDLNLPQIDEEVMGHVHKGIQFTRGELHAKLMIKFNMETGKGNPLITRYLLAAKVNSQDKVTIDDAKEFAEHRLSEINIITVINTDKSKVNITLSTPLKTIVRSALVQQEREISAFTVGGLIQSDAVKGAEISSKNSHMQQNSSLENENLVSFIGGVLDKYMEKVALSPSEEYVLRSEYDAIIKAANSIS